MSRLEQYLQMYLDDLLALNETQAAGQTSSRTATDDHHHRLHSQQLERVRSHDLKWSVYCRTAPTGRTVALPNMLHSNRISNNPSVQAHHHFLPNHTAGVVADYDGDKAFVGKFSTDGEVFVSACQDRHIRFYHTDSLDTTLRHPHTQQGDKDGVEPFKVIAAKDVGWSVLDVDFSRDQHFVVYSSWSNYLHLCNVHGPYDVHQALDMQPAIPRHFCAFSIRFSPDSREVLAGTSEYALYLYDIVQNQRVLKIQAHEDDISAVAFAEEDNSNIFFSGSDDALCKMWDRRCLQEGDQAKPVGVLIGHTDGITFIASKGDGRYVATNSKDQTMKLFDVRGLGIRHSSIDAIKQTAARIPQWDYRYNVFPRDVVHSVHPCDQSLMTYRGHRVLQTLIRGHFSPLATTGQKYLYCGSHDGCVYVYNLLTGDLVTRLTHHNMVVRDVAWHPTLPYLITTSWDGTHVAFDYQEPPDALPLAAPPQPGRVRMNDRGLDRGRLFHPQFSTQGAAPTDSPNDSSEENDQVDRQQYLVHQLHRYQQLQRLQELQRLLLRHQTLGSEEGTEEGAEEMEEPDQEQDQEPDQE
eukprot:NODE_760_length_1890_cov_25.587067_g707_i0.p1 GENE.NODE_760_length_1890_cov_25.587067_g707_i0~~NODE_760_length_1890_cov_25.587067_g707_i0.p1  ORF type:complete len:580 (-),score=147.56 NODE_760_length_1890_cov_25.587067_g707_i0:116-1855(-)